MNSTSRKTLKQLQPVPSLSAALYFLLLLFCALADANQFKLVRAADGYIPAVSNNGKTSTVQLAGIDTLETSKKKMKNRSGGERNYE